jgi:ABC-type Fe3+ transport system substrate-binding protein
MALLNGGRGNLIIGIAIGFGAALLVPVFAPSLRQSMRPAAKATMKAGLLAYERGRVAFAEFGEMAEDVMAEVKAELAAEGRSGEAEAAARAVESGASPVGE